MPDSQIDKYAEDLFNTHLSSRDRLIAKAILKTGGADSAAAIFIDHNLIKRHGTMTHFPDGREIFAWDGKPVIEFYPPTMDLDGVNMKISQNYRTFGDTTPVVKG